jgi:Domain of unknown function (DUF4124)
MTRYLLIALLALSAPAMAQVYRWVDEKGTVHYSNATPPAGVKSTVIDLDAKAGKPSPESQECYTVRCQGERMEQRLARREQVEARHAAERAAAAPKPPRGLDFRNYISLRRGMSEGEMLTYAGSPDLLFADVFSDRTYVYLPTVSDPFTTTVVVIGGRISGIERVRKF